jgi:hypothetical protein
MPTTPIETLKLVYFSKKNCAPCTFTKPVVEGAARATGVPLEHVDCSPGRSAEVDALIEQYQLRSVPAVVVKKGDRTVKVLLGSGISTKALEAVFAEDGYLEY